MLTALESVVRRDAPRPKLGANQQYRPKEHQEPKLVKTLILREHSDITKVGPAIMVLNTISKRNSAAIEYIFEYDDMSCSLVVIGTPRTDADSDTRSNIAKGGALTNNEYDFRLSELHVEKLSTLVFLEVRAVQSDHFSLKMTGMTSVTFEQFFNTDALVVSMSGTSNFKAVSFTTKRATLSLRDTCYLEAVVITESGTVDAEGRVTAFIVQRKEAQVTIDATKNSLPIKRFEESANKKRKRRTITSSASSSSGAPVSAPLPEVERDVDPDETKKVAICTQGCSRAITTVCAPCGHCLYCVTCANKLIAENKGAKLNCTECSVPVDQIIKLIFPE